MSRQLLAALAVLAAVIAAIVLWPEGDDEPDIADMSVEDLANLDLGARELVSLAVRGHDRDFHARYEGSDGRQIEVWVLADSVRQLLEGTDGVATLTQQRGDEATRCVDEGSGWACEPIADDAVDADELGLRGTAEQLTDDLVGASVTVTDDEIAGVTVRCFAFTSDDLPAEICLTTDGIVARLAAGTDTLELTLLDDALADGDFELPA